MKRARTARFSETHVHHIEIDVVNHRSRPIDIEARCVVCLCSNAELQGGNRREASEIEHVKNPIDKDRWSQER